MAGYIIVCEEGEENFWNFFFKFFKLKNEKKVTYKYKRSGIVIHRIIRNSKTCKFSPMTIEVCVSGSIDDNLHTIIKIPILQFYRKVQMIYCLKTHCWKVSMNIDINDATYLLETDDRIIMAIHTT